MKKPYVIRYMEGEERFNIKNIESKGYKAKFRDFAENIESLAIPGGKTPPSIHDDKLEAVTVESHPPCNSPIVIYSGSWGQEKLNCHDTIVIPPGVDHAAENISDLPVWLLITNFIVE